MLRDGLTTPYRLFSAKFLGAGTQFFIRRTLCGPDLENFQPLARFEVQKFAELTKFVLGASV